MNKLTMCLLAAGLGIGGGVCAGALADGPQFTLVDDGLTQTLISEPSGPTPGPRGELIYSDARGVPRELLANKVLALGPSWWTDPREAARGEAVSAVGLGLLVLTDGQRLPGTLSAVIATGESLAWEHPRLGRVVVPLERVSEVELPEAPAAAHEPVDLRVEALEALVGGREAGARNAPPREPAKPKAPPPTDRSRDTVELANGDRLAGLVESVGDEVVISGSSAGAKSTTVAITRVRRMWLANPTAAPTGAMVWLADGTVVGTKGFMISEGEPLRLGDWGGAGTPVASEAAVAQGAGEGGGAAPYTVEDVAAVAFSPKRLRPLADLGVRVQNATAGRKLVRGVRVADDVFRTRALPAPLAARDIELPAPMSVEFALPAGAARVSATIELPESSWTWGDCRVKVEAVGAPGGGAGAVLLEAHLTSDTPAAKLAGAIPSGATALRVSVEPGERGPVQDRVLVRRGLVLMAP